MATSAPRQSTFPAQPLCQARFWRVLPRGRSAEGIVQGSAFPRQHDSDLHDSPNATALLNAGIFPAANTARGGKPIHRRKRLPTNLKEEVVRIDHNFNSKWSIFGHFISEQVSQGFGVSQWSGANLPTVGDTFSNPSYSAVAHTTYAISPNLLNETAFNYNGNRISITPFAGSGLESLRFPTATTRRIPDYLRGQTISVASPTSI